MPFPSFHEHFRAIAGRYQAVRSLDQRAVRKIAQSLARAPAAAHGLRLLDVGTGTGRYFRGMTAGRGEALPFVAGSFDAVLSLRATYDYPWAIPVRNSHLIAVARRRA